MTQERLHEIHRVEYESYGHAVHESYRRVEDALTFLVDTGSSLKLHEALHFWNMRNKLPSEEVEGEETAFVHVHDSQHGVTKDEDTCIAFQEACDAAGFVLLCGNVESEVHYETWRSDEALSRQENIDIARIEALQYARDPYLSPETLLMARQSSDSILTKKPKARQGSIRRYSA